MVFGHIGTVQDAAVWEVGGDQVQLCVRNGRGEKPAISNYMGLEQYLLLEQNTFFIEDPNGNVLELKTFD